jgi:ribosome-associated protein
MKRRDEVDRLAVAGGKLSIPLAEFDLHYARSSGPGGQNVNKVNSKVVLYWSIAESPSVPEPVRQRFLARFAHRLTTAGILVLGSDKFRDQKRNVDDCLEKLAAMLAEALTPPKPRKKTKPHRGAKEKRLRGKREQAEKKQRRQKPDW